ncbi:MAG: alpha/beta hydrolase [Cyanothece sp. SIO1E1]|nr:alpha/beta hydrolase [Cyanothece sp. SIO1E1]
MSEMSDKAKVGWPRQLSQLMGLLVITYALFGISVFFFADRLAFQPPTPGYNDTDDVLKFTTEDGLQLSAVYLTNPKATYTLLFNHGNGEDLGDLQPMLQTLVEIGFNVFAYDYRGYGTSEGTPNEQDAYKDVAAAYHYLTTQLQIQPEQIIAYGYSIGGALAIDLAAHQPIAGLITESTFTKLFRVVFPWPILPFEKYPSIDKLKQVKCPILVMHGTTDEVIPFPHGKSLFAAAPAPKRSLWVEGAGHTEVPWVGGDQYVDTLQEFIQLVDEYQ